MPSSPTRRASRVTQLTLLRNEAILPGDDGGWTERLKAGDSAARDRFYRRYALDVWQLLLRLLGPDQELEDLHHEVFVHALTSIAGFRADASLWAWLRGVAVRRTRQLLRRRKRRWWLRFLPPEDVATQHVAPAPQPAELLAGKVRAVLAAMAAEERLLFMLRFVEQLTIAELAAACALSSGTVKRRLRRARRHFEQRVRREPALLAWLQEQCGAVTEEADHG